MSLMGAESMTTVTNATIFYSIKVKKIFFQIEFKLFRILQFNSAQQIKRLGSEMEETSQRNTTDVLRKTVCFLHILLHFAITP